MDNVTALIGAEHRNLAKVLKALETIVDRLDTAPQRGDVDRLFDICQYVRVFPDKIHHPKEEQYLFEPLRRASPDHAELLAEVQGQHEQCAEMTEELYQAVQGYDRGDVSTEELRMLAKAYLKFQFEHMRLEENAVLPLAESLLDSDVWKSATRAFSNHGDPLFGENLDAGFAALRERIVHAV